MKIYIGSDHSGTEIREGVIKFIESQGHEVVDCGTNRSVANYVTEGIKVSESVIMDEGTCGIIICGTGIGISIAANKVKGIRAALCHNVEYAKLSREHNNANILAMGARFITLEEAIAMTDVFLNTEFEAGRHADRVDSLLDYEDSCIDCD